MDDSADEGHEIRPELVLYAFELAGTHYSKGRSGKDAIHNRWDVAISILHRAVKESDFGLKLMELENEVERLREEIRKGGGGGTIYISGPFGLG